MKTKHRIIFGDARDMKEIENESVDLMITSPPYPMIKMWDEIFGKQNPEITKALKNKDGKKAFELMHRELDKVWKEMYRVLKSCGEVWIYDFITDVPKKDIRAFLEEVKLPKFPWAITLRLHGLKYKEWTRNISKVTERSKFDEYKLERNRILMKLILRKF